MKQIQLQILTLIIILLASTVMLEAQTYTKAADKKGCIAGDCKNGYGTYVYKDGTKYRGDFKNGLADGIGTCFYSNGDYYFGEWENHTFHGKGTLFFKDGEKFEGVWSNGDFLASGPGEEIKASQSVAKSTRKNSSAAKSGKTNKSVKRGKVWALIIGIANYETYSSLKYTDDDAYRLFVFLRSPEGGAIPEDNIKVLIDEAATSFTIQENLDKIAAKADSNDTILLYFSGHGIKGAFLPTDYNPISNNQLYHTEMLNQLAGSKAKNKIVIADICHAGSMEMVGNDSYATRGNIDNTIQSYYRALEKTDGGTALILASGSNEVSIENRGIRQGVFSFYMIEGLKGKADKDDNKVITIEEMFNYTQSKVKYYTNNIQNPMLIGDYDKNLPMGVVRN